MDYSSCSMEEGRKQPVVLLLSGGVGGAKLARGFDLVLQEGRLRVVVNTGDDWQYLGLRICPDLDTVMYALAGLQDPVRGWGVAGDTWNALQMLQAYGQEVWFRLGDRDLSTHILRSELLRQGHSLSQVTALLAQALGVKAKLYPMSDDDVHTVVETTMGELGFQEYFVRERARPEVRGLRFVGVDRAQPSPGFVQSLAEADLVVIGPSNPLVSIGPILALPGIRERLQAVPALRVAVSPIVGSQALKGPLVKMLRAQGREGTAFDVAEFYAGLVDVFILDRQDAELAEAVQALGMFVEVTDTVMYTDEDKVRLARHILSVRGKYAYAV